ncbi:MAG: hypothetical protein K2X87_11300 [Gemmataceae bacterium]|nr:hypothetical protein [Gemmataceae bacterium]
MSLALITTLLTVVHQPPAGGPPVPNETQLRLALVGSSGPDEARIAALGGYGPAAFPVYARILGAPDDSILLLIRTLSLLADPKVKGDRGQFRDLAVDLFTHDNVVVRVRALGLAEAIGGATDAPPVVALLWDEAREVVYAAAKTLATIGDRRAVATFDVWLKRAPLRHDKELRRHVENCQADLVDRLKKEEAEKAKKPAK